MQLKVLNKFIGPNIYSKRPGLVFGLAPPDTISFEIASLGDKFHDELSDILNQGAGVRILRGSAPPPAGAPNGREPTPPSVVNRLYRSEIRLPAGHTPMPARTRRSSRMPCPGQQFQDRMEPLVVGVQLDGFLQMRDAFFGLPRKYIGSAEGEPTPGIIGVEFYGSVQFRLGKLVLPGDLIRQPHHVMCFCIRVLRFKGTAGGIE